MRDQNGGYPLSMAIFDGRKLGPATALVDEDMLRVLLLEAGGGDKTIQLRYDSIGSVEIANASVTVKCRDGRTLVAGSEEAEALRQGLLAACRALPEVTRALRALGSRRGIVGGARRNPTDREGRFFAPLIAARRASMDARDARGVIGAFDARELTRSLSAIVAVFAREVAAGHPARQRALEAELSDGVESLERALEQLQQLAQAAQSDVEDLTRWRHWAAGVQRVFEAADRAWVTIESSLEGR